MILRPYQEKSIYALKCGIRAGHQKILLQSATGSGKTVLASAMIQSAVIKNKTVLFVAHRKEIIEQTSAKLDAFGIEHGIIMAEHPRYKPRLPVQVASIQTLSRRAKPPADLLIIDECHLSCSKSFTDLIAQYPDAVVIGLTATPIRLDGKGLGTIYSHMVEVIPVRELIETGFLVKPRVFAPFTPDMAGVRTVAGDYDQHAVSELMDKSSITGDIVKHWLSHANGRKTIAFAASVAHSEHIRDAFVSAGIEAKHLDATTPGWLRDKTLAEWREGKFDVLSNCGLFIEGLDVPDVSCVVLARPTQSLTIYMQAVGRGMRPAPGKSDVIILDHAGLTHRHGLVDDHREWSLDGKKKGKRKDKQDDKAISLVVCEECFATFSRSEFDRCPECDAELPKRAASVAKVDGDGELIELTAEHIAAIRERKKQELKAAKTKEQLIELGLSRGYKRPGAWADHILKGRQQWRGGRAYG
jgi:superfamily II DNA or RNA helicase